MRPSTSARKASTWPVSAVLASAASLLTSASCWDVSTRTPSTCCAVSAATRSRCRVERSGDGVERHEQDSRRADRQQKVAEPPVVRSRPWQHRADDEGDAHEAEQSNRLLPPTCLAPPGTQAGMNTRRDFTCPTLVAAVAPPHGRARPRRGTPERDCGDLIVRLGDADVALVDDFATTAGLSKSTRRSSGPRCPGRRRRRGRPDRTERSRWRCARPARGFLAGRGPGQRSAWTGRRRVRTRTRSTGHGDAWIPYEFGYKDGGSVSRIEG